MYSKSITPILVAQAIKIRNNRRNEDGPEPVQTSPYEKYQGDPIGFCEHELGEHFTDDIREVIQSVAVNPVTIAKSANAIGKTYSAARVAAWFYKCYPGAQVYTTSAPPVRNLEKLLWGEIYGVVNKHPNIFIGDRVTGNLNVQHDAQSFMTGVPIPSTGTSEQREAKFSGKHAPFLLFVVDEADAVPPEVFKGIESCLSGGMGRLLIMFNPRAEVGKVANMIRGGEGRVITLSALRHPNVVTGNDVIPGAVTRDKTVRRINQWTRPLAPDEKQDNECFEVPDFLVGEVANDLKGNPFPPLPAGWRKVENSAFWYMVLGEYPPQSETQLISQVWIDNAVMRYRAYVAMYGSKPPVGITPIAGFDLADGGNDLNSLCLRYGGFVSPLKTWKGIDVDESSIKASEILSRLYIGNTDAVMKKHSIKIFADGTGVGAGTAPRMRRMGFSKAEKVMVASSPTYEAKDENGDIIGIFFQLRDQLLWSTREWLRTDPGAMLPDDDDLHQELRTPQYEIKNGKIRCSSKDAMKELLGRSPDKMESLILTFAPAMQVGGALR